MATFVIIPVNESPELDETVKKLFDHKAFRLPRGEWLVSFDGTSLQLCEHIGIGPEVSPVPFSAVILNFNSYYGRASRDVWEWLSVNGAK